MREHGKTFAFMTRFMTRPQADGVAAVYGFARTVDDAVDEADGLTAFEVQASLDSLRNGLEDAVKGRFANERFAALADTIHRFRVPLQPFFDLVDGCAMDLTITRYPDWALLDRYCYGVAGTIGLILTPIVGYRGGSATLEYAKMLGTAMQLTNILRDVGEDLGRDRVYLPGEDLERFGVTEDTLWQREVTPEFRRMMRFQVERARTLYREGSRLLPRVESAAGRLAFAVGIEGYGAILDKIEENGHDVLTRRAYTTTLEKLATIPPYLLGRARLASHGEARL
jgi:phytoene synthase